MTVMYGLDKSLSKMVEHKSAYVLPTAAIRKNIILDIPSLLIVTRVLFYMK